MTALLLAEPEASVRGFLERQLSSDGFDVLSFETTDELPRAADPDVLVLGDAAALERCLVPDCPVIVLGDADPAARVRALERCDDYLSRPFVYEELVARIHAVLRRRPPRRELLNLGELVVDRAARRVLARGREVVLSGKEFALLVKLASDPDRVFTREQLLRDVWGYRTYVRSRVSTRDRKALGAEGYRPRAGQRRGVSNVRTEGSAAGPSHRTNPEKQRRRRWDTCGSAADHRGAHRRRARTDHAPSRAGARRLGSEGLALA